MLSVLLTACISTSLTKVEADPDFNWDTLKRDQILMTPLLDIRDDVRVPSGFETAVSRLNDKEREVYAEVFKQQFFKLRKDIRVFGAGGAFEKISAIENLPAIGRKILSKEILSSDDVGRIRSTTQDIRFVFFFFFADEELNFRYFQTTPQRKKYIEKTYVSARIMTIKMALWDSKTARTIWIGQKTVTPSNRNTVKVRRKSRTLVSIPEKNESLELIQEPDQWDFNERASLDDELKHHPSRFPKFPEREPAFSQSFDNFVLGIPIHPSEEKLLEYSYFTHHRGELGISSSGYGSKSTAQMYFGFSSIINNWLRLGFSFMTDAGNAVDYDGKDYRLSSSGYGLLTEAELPLSESVRLVTGGSIGGAIFKIEQNPEKDAPKLTSLETQGDPKTDDEFDFTPMARVRLQLLYGRKQGLQYGFGVHAIFYDGIDRPEIKANRPMRWGLDLSAAYTWRGF